MGSWTSPQTGSYLKVPSTFDKTRKSVRADGLKNGCPRLAGRRKDEGSQNMQDFLFSPPGKLEMGIEVRTNRGTMGTMGDGGE